MSLHPQVLADLLVAEVDVARERLGARCRIVAAEAHVDVTFEAHDRDWHLRLAGRDYDQVPLSAAFLDEAGTPLPAEAWPPGVAYGSPHPVHGGAWSCLRGTFEYHTYPGHTGGQDSWDVSRADLRLADLVAQFLEKAGAP